MGVYISRIIVYVTFIVLFVASQSACLRIYRQDLRQGNYVTQNKIDKLKVGLSKDEVQKIMGSPALVPMMDINRWDYYYSFMSGDRKVIEQKALSLYFTENKLKSFSGDWVPAHLPRREK
jgi:outer membrane protein assembly factor BamE